MSERFELTQRETSLVGECLRAAAEGPFFPEYAFRALMGVDRQRISQLAADWPKVAPDAETRAAVNNVLLNLWGYPHKREGIWAEFISATKGDVLNLLEKWRMGETHQPRTQSDPSPDA